MHRKLTHNNNNFITRLTPRGVQPLIFINAEKQVFNKTNVNIELIQANGMNKLMIMA